jgi:pimeloyl-ACP methyl ester carboxylesterase
MAFAAIGNVTLFFTDEGSHPSPVHQDPPLLFVHGYSCDSHDWSWQLAHFAHDHRVIAVDLRGHGRSSVPEHGYSAADFARDLAGLLDLLETGPVVAIGHSLGGVVVSALAVERPALVAALVCVDPAYLLPDDTAAKAEPFIAALAASDPVPLIQQLLSRFDSPGLAPALRTWQLRRAAGVPPHVLRETYETQVRGLTLVSHSGPYLARRTCPVLSVYADPARIEVETSLFRDKRSRAIAWKGAGHWLHQERPDEFNALVADWLAGLKI